MEPVETCGLIGGFINENQVCCQNYGEKILGSQKSINIKSYFTVAPPPKKILIRPMRMSMTQPIVYSSTMLYLYWSFLQSPEHYVFFHLVNNSLPIFYFLPPFLLGFSLNIVSSGKLSLIVLTMSSPSDSWIYDTLLYSYMTFNIVFKYVFHSSTLLINFILTRM